MLSTGGVLLPAPRGSELLVSVLSRQGKPSPASAIHTPAAEQSQDEPREAKKSPEDIAAAWPLLLVGCPGSSCALPCPCSSSGFPVGSAQPRVLQRGSEVPKRLPSSRGASGGAARDPCQKGPYPKGALPKKGPHPDTSAQVQSPFPAPGSAAAHKLRRDLTCSPAPVLLGPISVRSYPSRVPLLLSSWLESQRQPGPKRRLPKG